MTASSESTLKQAAALNRSRVFDLFSEGLLYVESGSEICMYTTDYELPFKVESFFLWLTGLKQADYGAILNFNTKEFLIVSPDPNPGRAMWCGAYPSFDELKERYSCDAAVYASNLNEYLVANTNEKVLPIYVLPKLYELDLEGFVINDVTEALTELRVIKTDIEMELIKESCSYTTAAFKAAMHVYDPAVDGEETVEATLWHKMRSARGGKCRHPAFTPISANGEHAATLHYPHNNMPLLPDTMHLLDAGAECHGYASDVTRTFPIAGRFNQPQRELYEAVLAANQAVIAAVKPGVEWEDMHRLSSRIITEKAIELGILTGSLEECLEAHAIATFYVHGLGHMMGLDVHDVGGYPQGVERIQEPGIMYLRARRTLQEGMVLTVEPGFYFNDAFIQPALEGEHGHLYDADRIAHYRQHVGGIRIEDDILVTKTGCENLTIAIPKTVEEIEAHMQQ